MLLKTLFYRRLTIYISEGTASEKTVTISSTNAANTDPNNAVDNDPKTFVHSMEINDEKFKSFPTLNFTYR